MRYQPGCYVLLPKNSFKQKINKAKQTKNVHLASLQGLRDSNEDQEITYTTPNISIYSVCDGHGGDEISRFISNFIIPIFTNSKVRYPLNPTDIKKYYENLQNLISTSFCSNQSHTGSTCCTVIIKNRVIYSVNVGDSRAILCTKDKKAVQLTNDHKPEFDKNRISKLGGTIDYSTGIGRIDGLAVSRAFGDTYNKYTAPIPEVRSRPLNPGDKFIIIACDGLYDVLTNDQIINYVYNLAYSPITGQRINKNINIAKKLAEYAIMSGSSDNVSIIIRFFD